jgi:hypothetical protein
MSPLCVPTDLDILPDLLPYQPGPAAGAPGARAPRRAALQQAPRPPCAATPHSRPASSAYQTAAGSPAPRCSGCAPGSARRLPNPGPRPVPPPPVASATPSDPRLLHEVSASSASRTSPRASRLGPALLPEQRFDPHHRNRLAYPEDTPRAASVGAWGDQGLICRLAIGTFRRFGAIVWTRLGIGTFAGFGRAGSCHLRRLPTFGLAGSLSSWGLPF